MNIKNLLLGILIFVIGLLLIIVPKECVKIIVLIVGAYAVFNGVTNLLGLRKKELNDKFKKTVIIKSLVSILIGLSAIVFPFLLVRTIGFIWKIVSYVLAACLIAFGITGFVSASMLSESDDGLKSHISRESIICFLVAILMIIIPIDNVIHTLFLILGIIAIVCGVALTGFEIFKIVAEKKAGKEVVEVDAEIIDDESTENEFSDSDKTE